MADKQKRIFYIRGRSYCPETSTPLCINCKGLFETVTLYRSPKGAFFTVAESDVDGVTVRLLDEAAARSFMDDHAAGIDIGNYNELFGEPEQG